MRKEKIIAYISVNMVMWLGAEAHRRNVSMSTVVRDALDLASLTWAPMSADMETYLEGQSEMFPSPESAEYGA